MRRFFGRPSGGPTPIISGDPIPDPARTEDILLVKHGKDEFTLRYPVGAITSTLTVGALRDDCSAHTSVDRSRVSLVCAGRNLKDDTATLSSLGISNAAKILLIASSAPPPSDAKPKKKKKRSGAKKGADAESEPEVRAPLTPMQKIDAVWDGVVANLVPLTEEFMADPPVDPGKRADMHRRLSETVMGELLKLDSVESSEPEVRARRKGVVKDVQRILDGLDRVLKEQVAASAN